MISRKVYRTPKGNLTWKEQGEHVYKISSSSTYGLEEALIDLKKSEKRKK